jgi:TLD
LSFNRLQNALLGYGGPTLLIVRSAEGDLFGAFTGSSWKESKEFYGNTDCFLFQLLPRVAVYRPTGTGTNFMYCNSFARSRGYDNQAHGIGFGGTVTEPRLFIAEAWDTCSASSRDLTFENGSLLRSGGSGQQFDPEAVEVWGVGGEDVVTAALGDRFKARALKDAAIQKARKVDKAAFLDDFRTGIIESKAFAHREQARGRADADLEDRDRETKQSRW